MGFHVGQKVVCIECGLSSDHPQSINPSCGDVATITRVYLDEDDVLIELAEFPSPETDEYFAGWEAKFFRPAVERETDISIFTSMLNRSKVNA